MGAHIVKTLKKKHPNSTVSLSQVSLSNTFKQQSFNLQLQYLLDFNIFKIFKMQFSYALIAAAACAVANAVIITNGPASFVGIQAGRALNITWADAEGPVTLTLNTVSTIASGLSGTSYAWAIPSTLPESFYALQIDDSSDVPNYSVRFEITGGPAASSSSASGSSTSTGSSSSASATSSSNSTVTSSSASSTGTGASTTSGTSSRTATTTSSTGSSTASAPPNTNAGASFASPLAFVLLAFAALMTLN